ncbi:MAG TPA: histidine kinase dimerization/phospho-acceptor domain-containing protein, partial [Bryobacteraceae bacterium]|nr:histidine kinase dimerization/phospho-acceptor domain-containing protein [Bryobacteraceae bacterium]
MANRPRLRVQDILLILLFGALIYLAHDAWQRTFISSLAVLQLIEGRVAWLNSGLGRTTSVLLQLIIGYLLIGYTGGVTTAYYFVLLFPVISTATYMGVAITAVSFFVAIGAYLSFLLFVDWKNTPLDAEDIHLLLIRCLLPAIIAVLVNALGESTRAESARYKRAAEQLAIANQNLVEAETAVRRSERLAALGQLSAGLAHELRNPLSSIKGSAELLARSAARDNPVAKELAQIIVEEADRTNSLVTRFLDFAR